MRLDLGITQSPDPLHRTGRNLNARQTVLTLCVTDVNKYSVGIPFFSSYV